MDSVRNTGARISRKAEDGRRARAHMIWHAACTPRVHRIDGVPPPPPDCVLG
jgi:hypothetical protein